MITITLEMFQVPHLQTLYLFHMFQVFHWNPLMHSKGGQFVPGTILIKYSMKLVSYALDVLLYG